MKKTVFTALILLIIIGTSAFGQTKKIRWTTELCELEGSYNSKKYTSAQLKNTQRLIGNDFSFDTASATVWKYEEIKTLNFAPVEAQYQKLSNELKNLKIVTDPFWETRRKQLLREIDQYYLLTKATMASYTSPKSLFDYKYADSCLAKYAQPLADGGNSLMKTWELVNIESRANNASPERLKRIFEEQRKSEDAEKFARVEVTAFGWWNCANALIDQGVDYSIREKNFRKLFLKVRTIECDEP